jgi:hypothetical protein
MAVIGKVVTAKRITNEHIHKVRKLLKDVGYLTDLIRKYWKTGLSKNIYYPMVD